MDMLERGKSSLNGQVSAQSVILLISSVVLAIGYDGLIVQPVVAVAYPIFVMIWLAIVYLNTRPLLVKKLTIGWALIFPLTALALTRFLFSNEVLHILNSIVIPVLIVAHLLLITGNCRYEWFRLVFLKDILGGLLIRPLQYAAAPFFLVGAMIRRDGEGAGRTIGRRVIMGLIFSLPILIVVVTLLSSADQVFGLIISTVLSRISIGEVIKHSLVISLITILAFSFIWGLRQNNSDHNFPSEERKKLDGITVLSGLSVIVAVYLLFSVIQFSYLFGSFSEQLPFGLTYAGYARRGFFELVAVALINIGLVAGTLNFTAIIGTRQGVALKGLNSILILSTFIMLFSAHYRMSLYEESYGYTYLRIFTHSFMIMVFAILVVTLYKIWDERINLGKWYVVIGLTAYVLINYVNVDVIIAQKNMARYYRTGVIDVNYMAGLSYDSLPYLVALTKVPDQKIVIAAQKHIAIKRAQLSVFRAWQGYNISEEDARRLVGEI